MTTQRKLHCSNPNCPHERLLKFSDWIRKKLPDSKTGYLVSDIDFLLYNHKTKKVMLIEQKTKSNETTFSQRKMFNQLHHWLQKGISGYTYLGYHCITFQNYCFDDGDVFYDGWPSNEKEIKEKLTF